MGIIIGIDVGISTTKIVGLRDGKPQGPIRITAADPITSLYGAFGKYLHDNNIELSDVEHVMLTGVGAAYVKGDVYGVPPAAATSSLPTPLELATRATSTTPSSCRWAPAPLS